MASEQMKLPTESSFAIRTKDGTVLAIHTMLIDATRIPGQFGDDGMPKYDINVAVKVGVVYAPAEFMKPTGG